MKVDISRQTIYRINCYYRNSMNNARLESDGHTTVTLKFMKSMSDLYNILQNTRIVMHSDPI